MKFITPKTAKIFMLLVATCWGTSYVSTKYVTDHIDPSVAFFLGNILGGLIFFIFSWKSLRGFDFTQLWPILKINSFSVISHILGLFAINFTTSTNAAFIIQLSVIMVPLLMAIRHKILPARSTVIGSIMALIGLAVLILDFRNISVNPGDAIQVLAALFFSLYLVALTESKTKYRYQDLMAVYYIMSLPLGLGLFLRYQSFNQFIFPINNIWFVFAFTTSSVIVLIAMSWQISVSRFIPVELMAVTYCFEPVITAILAVIILAERLDKQNIIGILFILGTLVYMNRAAILHPDLYRRKQTILDSNDRTVLVDKNQE